MFLTLNMEFKHDFFFTVRGACSVADPGISEPWGAVEFLVSGDFVLMSLHIQPIHIAYVFGVSPDYRVN